MRKVTGMAKALLERQSLNSLDLETPVGKPYSLSEAPSVQEQVHRFDLTICA
jgi:hypothetical protein